MIKLLSLLILFGNPATKVMQEGDTAASVPPNYYEKIDKEVKLKEVTITGFKENNIPFKPLSTTRLNTIFLQNNNINNIKELSALMPNFFMPDYGSKQCSPIYIRGIGSKINAPSVGFYVDGVPHFEKSAFDIDISEINNIEILRGPQGSLYGRNAIGGIINIFTHSPFDYQKTQFKVGYGSKNDAIVQASRYKAINDKLAYSISGKYHHNDGFFTNIYTDEKADKMNEGFARLSGIWKINDLWTSRLNASASFSKQNGYPYGIYNIDSKRVGDINYNDEGSYKRGLYTAGLNFRRCGDYVKFNSQTSFQFTDDEQKVDQDFTPKSVFKVLHKMRQRMYSQEFTLKSNREKRYKWIIGAFGFLQDIDEDLITTKYMSKLSTPKRYDLRNYGLALYHQSEYNIWKGLSAIVGLRYDYEHDNNKYKAYEQPLDGNDKNLTNHFNNSLSFKEFTPKFCLNYLFEEKQIIYASASRGYKTGGFNTTFRTKDEETFDPEYNWNYEVGTQWDILKDRLHVDFALFYIDWEDQQISQIVPGLGNIQYNAGHSVSKGVEFSLRTTPIRNFNVNVNYGYTHATFIKYDKENKYKGNFLPLVPKHTLAVNAQYVTYNLFNAINKLTISSGMTANGPIYWKEDNNVKQNFYALLNFKIAANVKHFRYELWAKNVTNSKYLTYYFKTSNHYGQQGKPFRIGGAVSYSF